MRDHQVSHPHQLHANGAVGDHHFLCVVPLPQQQLNQEVLLQQPLYLGWIPCVEVAVYSDRVIHEKVSTGCVQSAAMTTDDHHQVETPKIWCNFEYPRILQAQSSKLIQERACFPGMRDPGPKDDGPRALVRHSASWILWVVPWPPSHELHAPDPDPPKTRQSQSGNGDPDTLQGVAAQAQIDRTQRERADCSPVDAQVPAREVAGCSVEGSYHCSCDGTLGVERSVSSEGKAVWNVAFRDTKRETWSRSVADPYPGDFVRRQSQIGNVDPSASSKRTVRVFQSGENLPEMVLSGQWMMACPLRQMWMPCRKATRQTVVNIATADS